MIAVLHLAEFPLQAVLRLTPDLAEQAIALLDATDEPAAAAGNSRAGGTSPAHGAAGTWVCAGTPGGDALAPARGASAAGSEATASSVRDGGSISPRAARARSGAATPRAAASHDPAGAAPVRRSTPNSRGAFGSPAAPGRNRRAAVVIACTAAARAAGVELGQTAPQALARCAGLKLLPRRLAAEAEAQAALRAAAFSVSPLVEETAPGVCALHVAALPAERREPALRAALAQLAALGLTATAGLAATPWLAQCAALAATPEAPLHVVTAARAFLAALPLAAAEPSPAVAERLASWGLRTLGDLAGLRAADLTSRLGPEGAVLRARATGEADRPLRYVSEPPTFTAGLELEAAVETLEPLLFLLRRFLDRLALELATAGLAAGAIDLRLQLADTTAYARHFRLPEPTTQAELLFRALHTHLENLHTAAAITAVAITLEPVRPPARQHGIFDSALRDPHGFAETLARLVALVGSDHVGTPQPGSSHRPDDFRLVPPPSEVEAAPAPEEHVHPPRGLALRRWRPPAPATVELAAEAPGYVWADAVRDSVIHRAGPWRSSGDWWEDGQRWEREEWDVELASGGLYRLLRTPAGWFIEGCYD